MNKVSLLLLLLAADLPLLRAATFTVTNANPAGAGSLAQALLDANASPGADAIAFNITTGSLTIAPTNALPVITDTVTIDGSTQPGYSNAPLIEVSGAGAGTGVSGLTIAADGCVVRALAINRFSGDGVQITNGVGSLVAGCYLGVAPDGATRRGNGGAGVRLADAFFSGTLTTSSNVVGGTAWADHNLISANGYGIYLEDSQGNTISGNYIGTDATGTLDLGNTNSGVYVSDYLAAYNTIGGTNPGAGNLISGNGESYARSAADGVTLAYCFSNSVFGNFIGVDVTGTAALPNGEHGVDLLYGGGGHVIGGPGRGQRNLISGNTVNGVNLGSGGGGDIVPQFTGPVLPGGSVVQGNLVGTDVTGMSALPNGNDGVFLNYATGNTIGGSEPGEGNVISANLNNGVEFACCGGAYSNLVSGNLIGVTATNALPLGNLNYGVLAYTGNNVIGGTDPGAGNLIAYNGASGVQVSYGSTGVAVLGNAIYANTNFGIDLLGNYGPDPNDPGDADTGGNNVQNYPVLGFPLQFPTEVILSGMLNSESNAAYRVELFDNDASDPSGYGQGQTYLGFVTVSTDGNGNGSFLFTNPAALPLTHYLTATATDTNGNTSEFSLSRRVVRPDSIDLAVTITNSANPAPRATNFFFTVTVTNNGPANATGVVATDPLPAGLAFVSAVSSQGTCTQAAGVVTCNLGALNAGAGAVIVIAVQATITGDAINTASATGNESENDPSNNSASVDTTLGIANLAVLASHTPDPVVAGQSVTYTVMVTNSGPDPATSSTLYFYPDGNTVVTGASVSQGTVDQNGTVTCSLGAIPVDATATLTVTGIPTVTGTNYNFSTVYAAEYDPEPYNNNTNEPTVVLAGPGVLQFASAAYSVNESAGVAVITVQRTGGAIGTVSVHYATSNLTAIAGVDYVTSVGTLTFADGVTNNSFTVPILDDGAPDCNEALMLHLYQVAGGAVLAGRTNAPLEIFDNHRTPAGLVQVVSQANTNLVTTGSSGSFNPAVSDDGRYVVFGSYANNLVTAPPGFFGAEIYLRDRLTGLNTMVSLDQTGLGAADNSSSNPQISADGHRVFFLSYADNLTTNHASGYTQVYVRNLDSGLNQLVTVNTNGAGGNYYSDRFAISGDGTKVAFRSYASDLVPGDTNGMLDVFYRDLATGSNVLVSLNAAGTGSANGASDDPSISADGRYVAFGSYASNLSPADNNTRFDIYRRDMVAGTLALVSANGSGLAGNNSCGSDLFISGDGRYVAFESYASDLVPGSPSFTQEIFVRDLLAGTTILASLSSSNAAANETCYLRGLSQDGRYVLFESYANNLVSNATAFRSEIYLRDTWSNTLALVAQNLAGNPANAYSYEPVLSGNGRYVAFLSAATDLVATSKQPSVSDVFVRDMQAGVTTLQSTTPGGTGGNSDGTDPVVSPNGVVAFGSYASDLAASDNNQSEDVFARAPSESGPELLSQGIGITGSGNAFEQRPSADGTKVAFASYAANLVLHDTNGGSDVFLRDLASGATTLVSVNDAGNGSRAGNSDQPRPSADGRFVAFHNLAANIEVGASPPINLNSQFGQIFLRDTVSNTLTLVSVNRAGTAPGNGDSINPEITPDGTFVVFESIASDLVSNDVNGAVSDVFIRSRTNNQVELVSASVSGPGSADADSHNPVVSADGRYVAFESYASNLVSVPTSGLLNVYLRDRQTGSNVLCSHNLAGTGGGDSDSFTPAISADGRYVSFQSNAGDLGAGDTNNNTDVFVFDRVSGNVRLVSVTPGGLAGNGGSYNQSLSDDGRYVAFESTATNLVANDSNGFISDIFVRDLLAGTTVLVSVNCAGTGSGNDNSYSAMISGNGRYVAFQSYAFDLVPGDFSVYTGNLFRRDLQAGTTVLLSQNRTLLGGGNNYSYDARPCDNGSVVSFLSSAWDLVFGDVNFNDDAFAWTAASGGGGVDLALVKTASAATVGVGGALAYTLAVTNYGLATATAVVVTDALPAGLTFVSAATSQGTVATNGNLLTCSVGGLNAAAGARITVNVTPTGVGYVTNAAVAIANEPDTNPGNNSSAVVVQVTAPPPPALSFTVTNGGQLLLSWPSPSDGFNLETATNLTPVVTWLPVTNSVSDNGLLRWVLLSLNPAQPAEFYRLHHP